MSQRGAAGSVDVAIIGGGIVGAATAAFLAEAGASVALFERTGIAAGASGRNQGLVQHPFDPVMADLYRRSLSEYRRLSEDARSAFALPSEPAGLLYVSHDPVAPAEHAVAWAAAYPATEPRLVYGPDLTALEPALAPDLFACRLDIGFPVMPATATQAFAGLAERHGATFHLDADASLELDGATAVGVRHPGGVTAAGAVVVAAGPWTPGCLDPSGRWRPIVPIWGVIAAVNLHVPPGHILEEAEIRIEPADDDPDSPADPEPAGEGLAFSLVSVGGSSALGATFLPDEPDGPALVPAMVERGARFVPGLARASVGEVRVCARPVSIDGRPLVGRVPGIDRAWVAAGHGPWGISTGPATARLVAELVLGREIPVPAALDPARFGRPFGRP